MPRIAKTKPVEVERPQGPFVVIGIIVVGLLATGGTILWAQYDDGQIDVTAAITQSRTDAINNGEEGSGDIPPAPAPEYTKMPNGGLQAQTGNVPQPPSPEPVATENASSTGTTTEDGTSTSTPSEENSEDVPTEASSTPAEGEGSDANTGGE